jgi:predicted Rdx family selenoprotein
MDIRREAGSLKRELERSLGVSPSVRWGGPGQLDVLVDGEVVFSKKSAGRMPAPGELEQLIRGR